MPKNSRINETLHFLLDHPRRCFIYLFPSHQTWFLLTILICLKYVSRSYFKLWNMILNTFESCPCQFHGLVLLHGLGHREPSDRLYPFRNKVCYWAITSCCGTGSRLWYRSSICSRTSSKVRQMLVALDVIPADMLQQGSLCYDDVHQCL